MHAILYSPLEQAKRELSQYCQYFPEETQFLTLLASQLQNTSVDVFDRKNMTGHITSSAFVLDPAARKVLLIHHKFLQRWLQPGGHFEGTDPIEISALREAVEETGVVNPRVHDWHRAHNSPLDIGSHDIPAQARKAEGPHVHHDYLYLVTADSSKPLVHQPEEVHDAKWVTVEELAALNSRRFTSILRKLRAFALLK